MQQAHGQIPRSGTEFVYVACGLRQEDGELRKQGFSEQGRQHRGGNEISARTDFMASSGVVTEVGSIEDEFHETGERNPVAVV